MQAILFGKQPLTPKTIRLFIVWAAFGTALFWTDWALAEPAIQLWNPLATVNGFIITPQDLTREIGQLRAEMDFRNQPITDAQIESLRPQLVENLVERELLYQQAQLKDIKIRSQWVDRELIILKQRFKDADAYQQYLNQMDMEAAQLEERIRKGLIIRRLIRREILRQIRVSESEMQSFYRHHSEYFRREEQVRARHILVAVPSNANAEQKDAALLKIQTIQTQLQQGGDFALLALEYSNCPSKNRGGDLGFFSRDQMVKDFSDVAFSLGKGQISEVVATRYGYHLIQLIDRRPATQMPYKNVRAKIERTLRRDKEQEAVDSYLASLKRRADIKRY
jgi:peptidyl-prolyl cis-trans isomerase C